MTIRVAASALAALLWGASLYAQAPDGSALSATGQLVSTGMSLVLKADDGRQQGPFIITTTTQLPSGLAAGSRVTVFYHPVGDRQVADRVVAAAAPGQPTPSQTRPTAAGRRPSAERPTAAQSGRRGVTVAQEPGGHGADRAPAPASPTTTS
jgi:hypothetical protein